MPFQSEKQRRYLHANHPEIAKRWERDYANGGISNHFRKKFDVGSEDSYQQLLDDWDAGFIKDALPGEDFTTYYNRIMKVENDTGTEDIELLNLLSENQDPLNLSQGVTTLFQAKKGGTPRRRYFTGAYGGGGDKDEGPPGGGATSMGSGRDYSPAPTRDTGSDYGQFDRAVSQAANNPPSTKSDSGGDGLYQDQIMKIAEQQKKTKEKRETASQEGWHQFLTPRHKTPAPKEKSFLDKLAIGIAVYTGVAPFLGLKVPSVVSTAGNLLSKRSEINTALKYAQKIGLLDSKYTVDELFDKQVEKMKASAKERKEKMDLYESLPPGHPDKIALEVELGIGTKPDHLGDDGGTPSISVPVVTEELEEAIDEGEIDMFDAWSEIKRKQALNASLQAKWAAEQEARDQSFMVANKGGLANLFRVKKQ